MVSSYLSNLNKIQLEIFGASHASEIGVNIFGIEKGIKIDKEKLQQFLARRAPGQAFSTPRKEGDVVEFISGVDENGKTTGEKIVAVIKNTNVKSKDYSELYTHPRPSHSELVSFYKYGADRDVRGGGHFSARMTAPLCIAGGIFKQILEEKGIQIGAHLSSVYDIEDEKYDKTSNEIKPNQQDFPVLSCESANKMKEVIKSVSQEGDSVGATVECKAINLPIALGEPMFYGIENVLSSLVFAIPAVKGFEIGNGFEACKMKGSENNDEIIAKDGKIATKTNNAGGVNGGITNGMPLVFKVGFKPTPSISKPQNTINLDTLEPYVLQIKGRHDPCVGVRAVPIVEAVCAIALAQFLL